MNNDLISRSALIKAFHELINKKFAGTYDFEKLINNAPTVFDDKAYSDGYTQGTCDCEHAHERPQGELADEVWKLYKRHQSHLATHVYEFGDELKELLDKYQKGGAE